MPGQAIPDKWITERMYPMEENGKTKDYSRTEITPPTGIGGARVPVKSIGGALSEGYINVKDMRTVVEALTKHKVLTINVQSEPAMQFIAIDKSLLSEVAKLLNA